MTEVRSPLQGTIVSVEVSAGDVVRAGTVLFLIESMKMHHDVSALEAGRIGDLLVDVGAAVMPGDVLVRLEAIDELVDHPTHAADAAATGPAAVAGAVRPDLAESIERHRVGLDEARPDAVARRRARHRRTARENVADLVDADSFIEYGPVVIAAQRRRRELQDLIANTPADGLVGGIGTVNGELFGPEDSRCVAVSYDYTVLAGTQGLQNHRKKDRLFELAERLQLPIVFFTEGGGGRPGDTDGSGPSGLDCLAFMFLAELSGLVPL
ncbi:MAG: biotin/lipoyl-containing protein, partial [Ilumatobacteraceae bacterium]